MHIFACALYNNMTNFFHNKRKSCTIKRKQQKALTDPTVHPSISLFPLPPYHSLSPTLSVCLRVDVSTWDAWVLHNARERPLPSSIRSNRGTLFVCSLSHTHSRMSFFFGFAIDHWTLVVKTRARPKFLHSLDGGCECVWLCVHM